MPLPLPLPLPLLLLLLLLSATALLSGCFSYQEVTFKGITDLQVGHIGADGVAARAMVTLENPNGYRIQVKDPNVDLYLNEVYVGKAVLDSNLTLEKRCTRDYAVPMHASFDGHSTQAMAAIMAAAFTGKAHMKAKGSIVGKAFLFRKRLPFEQEHDLDLSGQ